MPNWSTKDIPNLTGKVAMVTGGTRGIGLYTAIGLASAGAEVTILGSNLEHGENAVTFLKEKVPCAKITYSQVDFASLKEIADFANKSESARVVNVSSYFAYYANIHFDDIEYEKATWFLPHQVYSQSKLANLAFTAELQKRSDMKVAVVTGGTRGIGLHTAIGLASAGAEVTILGSNFEHGENAEIFIKDKLPSAKITYTQVDFASLKEIADFANEMSADSLGNSWRNHGVAASSLRIRQRIGGHFATNSIGNSQRNLKLLSGNGDQGSENPGQWRNYRSGAVKLVTTLFTEVEGPGAVTKRGPIRGTYPAYPYFRQTFNEMGVALDILVNNAGVFPRKPLRKTFDGVESTFGINHLASFALTAQLLPSLRKSPSPRVVNVSNFFAYYANIHFDDIEYEKATWFLPHQVYSQSKLANLAFTAELQKRIDINGWGLTAVSIMPGLVRTSLVETVFDRYPIFGRLINQAILPLISNSAEKGAKYSLFGATSPAVSPGGLYGPPGSYVAIRGPVRQITKLLTSFDRECI
ncbi:Dehydrogenase/reductase SDR family member on chromosome X [Folsomia candida]|uniref:Dehydrogenase/reductase SDR family member on chromosome X n=1 Tax=Folsomia candida TaxID=158441 RepID=A0A226D9B8_FOLCA|nr:Dehydrogenase/reductase SDR family member on chromosome X [Folsomia candida]